MNFDPNARSDAESGIFGLPFTEEESQMVYLPVPWDATTSYKSGTHQGPASIISASHQLDLFDYEVDRPYLAGMFMQDLSHEIISLNHKTRAMVEKLLAGKNLSDQDVEQIQKQINDQCIQLNTWVYEQSKKLLAQGKWVGLVGGDHSTPFGYLQALSEIHSEFGILHFDAHSDTRDSYMGFTYSHASIMHNVLQNFPQVNKLVQVGIRDFSEGELSYVQNQGSRCQVYFDQDLQNRKMQGETWAQIVKEIIDSLPAKVYVSFDIDGLNAQFCPHTGTPVPGGLSFHEATYLLRQLSQSQRTLIGFDLVEVAPHPEGQDEWDANVGMRLLYKLSAYLLASHKKVNWR